PWVDLVHPVDERPLLVVQPDGLAPKGTWPMDQVALNEVADLRPPRRPELLSVLGDHQDRHYFTTRRSWRGSAEPSCDCSTGLAGWRRRLASSPRATSHCRRLLSTGLNPNLASCSRISCSS